MKQTVRILLLILLISTSFKAKAQKEKVPAYNVLFIFVDDLRPELGCYGNTDIHSPNLDFLASQATVFKKQFVTVPTCGASRASILTGRLPRNTNDLSNEALELKKTTAANEPESFIQAFRNSGYYTVGIGKISHSPDGYIYKYLQPKGTQLELPKSWDEMLFDAGRWRTGWNAFFGYANGSNRNELKGSVKPFENADVDDESYPDGLTAKLAITKLKELAARKKPFFLGLGFFKPHLPFNAPKKYWDLYDESKIPLTQSPYVPKNVNPASFHQSSELNGYRLGDEKASLTKPLSDAYARKLKHGYYAGVSYVDAQIGKVLTELKKQKLDKNTIIVVWGDHGWHLGDDRVWGKHTVSEYALRSPLIIKVPGIKAASCDKIVSSVDLYPTLMELCQIKPQTSLDGQSLLPLLNNPDLSSWNNRAYSYFRKGISLRTDKYRFTTYFRPETPVQELYDHQTDPYENNNIAAAHPDVIKSIMPLWMKGNMGVYDNQEEKKKTQEE